MHIYGLKLFVTFQYCVGYRCWKQTVPLSRIVVSVVSLGYGIHRYPGELVQLHHDI